MKLIGKRVFFFIFSNNEGQTPTRAPLNHKKRKCNLGNYFFWLLPKNITLYNPQILLGICPKGTLQVNLSEK